MGGGGTISLNMGPIYLGIWGHYNSKPSCRLIDLTLVVAPIGTNFVEINGPLLTILDPPKGPNISPKNTSFLLCSS